MHWVRIVKRQLVNLITSFTKMAAHPFNSKVVSNLKQRKHQAEPKALTDEETLSRTETLLHRIAVFRIVFHLFSHAAIGAPLSFGFSNCCKKQMTLTFNLIGRVQIFSGASYGMAGGYSTFSGQPL